MNEVSGQFGFNVAFAGDTNGDGYADFAAGAVFNDGGVGAADRGAAYLYYGSASGIQPQLLSASIQKSQQIHSFETIADLYASMGLELQQEGECTVHTLEETDRPIPMKSPPFRAGYYTFYFLGIYVPLVGKKSSCYKS